MAAQSPAATLDETPVIRTKGGVFEAALRKNFFDPFSKTTGVKVIAVAASYGDMMAKSAAMKAAGKVDWDIICKRPVNPSSVESRAKPQRARWRSWTL